LPSSQEAFLRCWRMTEGRKDIQNVRAWIFRVALNAAKDLQRSAWKRRVKRLLGNELLIPANGSTPPDAAEEREAMGQLRQALYGLRPEEKEVFLLRQNADLTYDEIADLHQRPVGTVKTQMRSALLKLRKMFAENP